MAPKTTKPMKPASVGAAGHGHRCYADCAATWTCVVCRGPLARPVPRHADFHQTCDPCWALGALQEAYRPRTRAEAEASAARQALLAARFPPDGLMVRKRAPSRRDE